jgi:hypothetical protein
VYMCVHMCVCVCVCVGVCVCVLCVCVCASISRNIVDPNLPSMMPYNRLEA